MKIIIDFVLVIFWLAYFVYLFELKVFEIKLHLIWFIFSVREIYIFHDFSFQVLLVHLFEPDSHDKDVGDIVDISKGIHKFVDNLQYVVKNNPY